MPRRMSCSLTVDAVRARIKTVTRREPATWNTLKPGDRITLVEKAMGLPKGAKQVVLADVEITDVSVELLRRWLTHAEVVAEGFPGMSPVEFVDFWLRSHGYKLNNYNREHVRARRIEWRYLEDDGT